MYLDGEPSKLVQNCSAYPDKSVGYYQAWELLKVVMEIILDQGIRLGMSL